MCLDDEERVWFMLHSGSRGPGNRIGTVFIELAKNDMLKIDKQAKVCLPFHYRSHNIYQCFIQVIKLSSTIQVQVVESFALSRYFKYIFHYLQYLFPYSN